MRHTFNVTCIKPFKGFWQEGKTYSCQTWDFQAFYIECEHVLGNPFAEFVGPGAESGCEDFFKYFKTDYQVKKLPPVEFIDPTLLDEIYRSVWKSHVVEDLRSAIENTDWFNDERFSDEQIDKAATAYVNGRYDCNLPYWENLLSLLEDVKAA